MYAQRTKQPTNDGFIALITAILLSAALLILVVAVSLEGYFSRFTVLESEQKEISIYAAETCVQLWFCSPVNFHVSVKYSFEDLK